MLGALSQASGHPITTASRASAASHHASSSFALAGLGIFQLTLMPCLMCNHPLSRVLIVNIEFDRFNALQTIARIKF